MRNLNLYIIRHGQTEWNVKEQMQGSQDSPLTENGILEAKVTGKYLKNIPFIAAYSSPQLRAVGTRDYILSEHHHSVPTYTLDGLREMDFGIWEGQNIDALKELSEFNLYMNEPAKFDCSVNKGEDFLSVLIRMKNSLDEIVNNTTEDNGNILVVSHGVAIRLLLCVLNGGNWHRHRDENYFPRISNTSISLINYQGKDQHGHYSVNYLNNIDHLSN